VLILFSELQYWYSVSKTLAEKAAWDFAAKEGLQMAVLNPGMVLGPMLAPSALFAWLISHQPAVLFSHNKSATGNQPAVLFSHNKPAPTISHQLNEQD
jgi:nucleoside-diphosphate-sugar epimerase